MKMFDNHRRHICTLGGALTAALLAVSSTGCDEEEVQPTPPQPELGEVEMRGDVEQVYASGAFRFDVEAGPNEGREVLVIPPPGAVFEEGLEVDVIADVSEVTEASFEEESGLRWEDNYEDTFTEEEIILAEAVAVTLVE